ncbi:MAG TPA: hypothetical protein VJR90_07105 [Gammaproteobacteria bacterium]|nr:hypothetical protein [Gammaproteobacteria bacterium]
MSHFRSRFKLSGLTAVAAILFAGSLSAAPTAQLSAPVASVAPAGTVLIGNFEGKTTVNKQYGTLVINHSPEFGWGWSVTTDQRAGGNSVAEIALIHPGAAGTRGALQITGEIKPGFPYGPWAGAIWFPGHEPMQPADLSAKTELTFWARGKAGSYNLMLMSGSPGDIPLYASFVTTPKWKEYHIPLAASFPNADWKQVYFLAFSAANQGKFQFDLDQVSLH